MQVRFVQVEAIKRQLDANHIVLLSNLAYSAAGEVLNCDIYSVATRAAVDLQVSYGAVPPDCEDSRSLGGGVRSLGGGVNSLRKG